MNNDQEKHVPSMFRVPLVTLGVMLVVLLVILYMIPEPQERIEQQSRGNLGEDIRTGLAPMPEFTDETQAKLEMSSGFQHLVSYTNGGFEPAELTVKRGETVRFTNNSSSDLWIAADGTSVQIYPRSKSNCSSSDLDSCNPFSPQDFWEFTFDLAGEWHVINNLDKTKGARIVVR